MVYLFPFLVVLQILLLAFFGQPWVCECGVIHLWEGDVFSSGNSQQFMDWYSFSHIIHGFIFWFLARALFPKANILQHLLFAFVLEIGWEILENTPWVIDRYRQQALAQGYVGDSILNSVSDVFMMAFGFWLASKSRVWFILLLILLMELGTGLMIRDNLTLNIINLVHPFEVISEWQSAGN